MLNKRRPPEHDERSEAGPLGAVAVLLGAEGG